MKQNTKAVPDLSAVAISTSSPANLEMRYLRLFETAQDGIVLIDAETGTVLDVNPAFAAFLEMTRGDLVQMVLRQIGFNSDDGADPSLFDRLATSGNFRFENLSMQTDVGEWREVELVCNAYSEPESAMSRVIQCNMRDITERRRTERALEIARARERHIAWTLQRPLTIESVEDAFPGLLVSALYAPASAPDGVFHETLIGGDFHDAFALPDGRVALVVADTLGKGVFAATRGMQIKDMLRAFARDPRPSTADIVTRLNQFTCLTQRFDDQDSETFSALALAFLNPETGDGEFVSAGSEAPIVLREGASGAVEHIPIDDISLPLGINAAETYKAVPVTLSPGDTLILMTDGITEARALRSDADAALAVLSASLPTELAKTLDPTQSPRDMAMAILEGARAFAGGALEDDACLLLARRRIEGNK